MNPLRSNVVDIIPRIRIGLSVDQERSLMGYAEKMRDGLKLIRSEYESDWIELSKYFAPHLCKINDTTKTKKSKWSNIINSTGRRAVRTLASGMQSGLTSPARPWFKLGIEDTDLSDSARAKEWLETSTRRVLTTLRRSNFYNVSHSMYGVLGIFGTAAQLQTQDFEDTLLFKCLMTGRYWVGVSARGRVNRVVILNRMDVIQMVELFGLDKVDPATRSSYDKGDYFEEKEVWTAIFPNPYEKRKGQSVIIGANQKPFVSVYWVDGYQYPIKTSGYDRFPVQVPRWETTDDEAYGVGVGIDAIGDTKSVQMKEREKAIGLKTMNRPPLSAPHEMRQGQYPISGLPNGITYRPQGAAPDSIRSTYEVNLPLQYLIQDIKEDEYRINSAFYTDLFLMMAQSTRRDITATEVAERHEEKLLALGPVIERLGNEYLDQTIERAFEIMHYHGEIPPPPEEIQGHPLKVEYISVLAQAQQQVGIGSIEKFLSFTGYAAQMFPDAIDKIDIDQSIDEVGSMLGVPQRVIRSDESVIEIRSNRAKQQQQATALQIGMAGVQAAKDLSQTPIGDSNALSSMVGV